MTNLSIYARPKEPIKLSQFDILRQIHNGKSVLCGKCGNPLKNNDYKLLKP